MKGIAQERLIHIFLLSYHCAVTSFIYAVTYISADILWTGAGALLHTETREGIITELLVLNQKMDSMKTKIIQAVVINRNPQKRIFTVSATVVKMKNLC